eukprot:g54911.t1
MGVVKSGMCDGGKVKQAKLDANAFHTMLATRRSLRFLRRSSMSSFCSSSSAEKPVLVENVGKIRVLTLNNPRALNALNCEMINLMRAAITEDPSVIVMQGAGGKAFCAGGDVVAVAKASKQDRTQPNNVSRTFFRDEYKLDYQIATLKTPILAFMDGITMGGGVGISINSPIRVATANTLFAMPEAAIGLFCDVGGSYFLPRLPGNLGLYIALTGARVKGKDAVRMGLATHYVDAASITKHGGWSQVLQTQNLTEALQAVAASAPDSEPAEVFREQDKINKVFAANTVEDILQEAEKEASQGSKVFAAVVQAIRAGSPLSLKVILEQYRRGAKMTLRDVFRMEYRMSQHFMDKSDFYEGVRGLLIDKDKKFNWSPATLSEVSDELVNSYFAPLKGIPELELPS